MPYRNQTIAPVCGLCHEQGSHRCRRCGAPLCDEHRTSPLTRCPPCEEQFHQGTGRAVVWMGLLALALVGVVFVVGWIQAVDRLPNLPIWTFVVVLTAMFGPVALFLPLRRLVFLLRRGSFASHSASEGLVERPR